MDNAKREKLESLKFMDCFNSEKDEAQLKKMEQEDKLDIMIGLKAK